MSASLKALSLRPIVLKKQKRMLDKEFEEIEFEIIEAQETKVPPSISTNTWDMPNVWFKVVSNASVN